MRAGVDTQIANRSRLPFWAGVFVTIACLAILILSGWREWSAREAVLENAEIDMANLARSLTQHAEDSVELADATLLGLANRLESTGIESEALAGLQSFLNDRRTTLGRIRGLFVYDEIGEWVATTESVNLAGLNNSDRAYFQHHRDIDDRQTFLGPPLQSRSGGQWIITISRRFNHRDGRFAGVVAATIDVAYFAEFYRRFDIGPRGTVTLLNKDGILLARSVGDGSFVGRDLSTTRLIREQIPRASSGTYYFRSPLDGLQRLSFYKVSDRFPFVLLATQAEHDVLARWRQGVITRVAFVVGLALFIALVGIHLVRQLVARQRLAAAIAAKEADFRLLAEESSDLVTRIDFDERILYASPASARVLGWAPAQLVGTSALAGVNHEDRPRVEQTIEALKRGEMDEARMLYRIRHREKSEIWVETTMRATRNSDTGLINGFVALSRDMTQHKDLEAKLAVLAASDGLTGLGNRRCFDERLEQEWARARREGTPISLLMIDIDHFKMFNDQFGHQAGDSCLRTIASVLANQALRSADLAARYGGEEFALLLPNTDSDGCEQVGTRVLEALHEIQIEDGSVAAWRTTASIGGATIWPNAATATNHASLVEAADRALYAAKNGGRDRLMMAGKVIRWPGAKTA
ncbi:diguanylate cyclase [Bosea sp. 2RAB26]|uniref:diguanylate cyclase n=1 Tax=Bosea sp. 2RAB26 TaxID=3237476 RepID=UPI003F911F2D